MKWRWLKFNAVGAIGIVVQLVALAGLRGGLGIHYLVATALAVEIAVLHNFCWHEHWTWQERTVSHAGAGSRLLRFNLTNGAVSIATNLLVMRLLVGYYGVPYLPANLFGIAAGSLVNFFVSELFVFRRPASTL